MRAALQPSVEGQNVSSANTIPGLISVESPQLLLWPRGARRELAESVAGFYRAVIAYLDRTFDRVLGFEPPAGIDPARRSVIQAAERAGEAFDAYLNERSGTPLDPETAGFLLAAGNHAILAGDLLDVISTRMGYQAGGCPDGARAVRAQVRMLLNGFARLAESNPCQLLH